MQHVSFARYYSRHCIQPRQDAHWIFRTYFLPLWMVERAASLVAQLVRNPPTMHVTSYDSWVRKIPWKRDRLPISIFLSSLVVQLAKNPTAILETWVWCQVEMISWRRAKQPSHAWRIPMGRGTWVAAVHGVTKSLIWLND